MNVSYVDRRAGRDFLASGAMILLLAGVIVLIAVWYVKPRPMVPVPPPGSRVTMIPPGMAAADRAGIQFSLPGRSGSRTIATGSGMASTRLSPRVEDVRYLPRQARAESPLNGLDKPPAPAFKPWREEAPVFAPVAPAPGAVNAEPLEGAAVELPPEWAAAAWPAGGAWSALARLEAGPDGRVAHVFLMPPAPPPAVAARLEALLRQARLPGGAREARVRISRTEPAGADAEGVRP